ncbi:MAG: hypothetical protein ACRCYU_19410 [Nocardioides sp.]
MVGELLEFVPALVVGFILGWLLRGWWIRRSKPAGADHEVSTLRQQLADRDQALAACQEQSGQYAARIATLTQEETPPESMVTESSQDESIAKPAPLEESEPIAHALAAPTESATPPADVAEGGRFLGRSVKLDDLKVVEGIGPAIEKLCHARGIDSWRKLQDTPVAELRSMLEEAGARFRMHDPASWPRQAGMLADGEWAEFKTLTDELSGGRQR